MNESEFIKNANETRWRFHCWYYPSFEWELVETTLPWFIFVITILAAPAVVVLNVLEIVAVRKKKQLQRVSTIMLSSLAVADVLTGAVSMPLTAAVDLLIAHQTFLDHVCIVDFLGVTVMFSASRTALSHLTVIAWERYMAVCRWTDYKTIITRGRAKKLALFAWLPFMIVTPYFVLRGTSGDVEWFENVDIIEGIFWGVAVVTAIVYFYVNVYLEVRNRKRNEVIDVNALLQAKQSARVAKTTGLITGIVILSFLLPSIVAILGNFFTIMRNTWFFRLTETLMQLNSLANPLVYCYRDRRFRNAILEMLRLKKSEKFMPNDGATRRLAASVKNPCSPDLPLRRTASSSGFALVLESVGTYNGTRPKRSMSAPSLGLRSTCVGVV